MGPKGYSGGGGGGSSRRWDGDEVSGKDLENNTGLRMRRHILRGLHLGWRPRAAELESAGISLPQILSNTLE